MPSSSLRKFLLLPLILVWILFVLGGYYYFHKPISFEIVLPPLQAALDLLFSLAFVGLAGGIGRRLLRSQALPSVELAIVQFAIGTAVLSFTWYGLGLLKLYILPWPWLVLPAGLILLRRESREWYRLIFEALFAEARSLKGLERFLAVLAVIFIFYQLVVALAPPLKWDALTYHLQLPRLYLHSGGLAFTPENPYWGHPQLVEMLYVMALSFHRPETAAVLSWTTGVLFLIGIYSFTNHQLVRVKEGSVGGEKPFATSAGWMAVTALLAGMSFRHQFAWSYCDLFSALFGLAILIAFFHWLDHPAVFGWYALAGLFTGVAAGTKWTSGIIALALFPLALTMLKSTGLSLKKWFLGGFAAFLATTPWLIKNLIVTGNPVYPYFFTTPWIDSTRSAMFNGPPDGVAWWMFLFAPVTSTWIGIEGAIGYGTDIGPLLLLFMIPGFWIHRSHKKTRFMLIAVLFMMLSLMFLGPRIGYLQQTRLYYVLLPCMAIPAGWGWEWLQQQNISGVRFRRLVGTMVILVMVLSLWQETYWVSFNTAFQVLLGTKNQSTYRDNNLSYYALAMTEIQALPSESRVLMLWEPRGFYAPITSQPDLWLDRWVTDFRSFGDTQAVLSEWKRKGFTHLLVYHLGEQFIQPGPGEEPKTAWLEYKALITDLPVQTAFEEWYTLYRIP